jgi:molecular chaperone DnaJ
VLGVPRNADQAAVKDAFRKLALRFHPDRNKEPGAEDRFKEIAEAYAVLSDPKKRSEYDAGGFAGVAGFTPEDLFGGINFDEIFGGLGFDFGLGGGVFDRFFRRRKAGPARGENLEVVVRVPLEGIARGGQEKVRLKKRETCPACRGSGAKAGTQPKKCESCGGTGRRVTSRRDAGVMFQSITSCVACYGRGETIEQPCPECKGAGEVEREETLTVNIPPGVEEGMVLRVPGHGLPSRDAGGGAGDLFVVVQSAPDPRFQRDGADLWHREEMSVVDAVLGTSLQVPTLNGNVKVTVPPGTQPDSVLRLKGKGLPHFGTKGRGDLFLRIQLRIPDKLGSEERKLWERLRAVGRSEKQSA